MRASGSCSWTRSPTSLDGSALATVLADPAVRVVVHAGRQDVALIRRRFGTEVRNVFDTQVAAGFAGLGAQSSYESLLTEILGLRVAKTASFTRWDAAAAVPRAARLRPRGRRAPARPRRRARAAPGRERAAAVGTRGVRAARRLERRARPAGDLRAAAADREPQRLGARGGARARGVARGHRRAAEPAGAERPRRRRADGGRKAQTVLARRAHKDPRDRRRVRRGAAPSSCSRSSSEGASARPSRLPSAPARACRDRTTRR